MSVAVLHGDALSVLRTMPERSVQCCVTSPPYYGLRDYGVEGQIGLEQSPEHYVQRLVEVFREVRRVLRDDGTLWLNLGDCYAGSRNGPQGKTGDRAGRPCTAAFIGAHTARTLAPEVPAKNRLMIPARVALALQADGWWLRDEIVWHKPRTTPFPANDRTVSAHEMVYLFAKRERYFFDWAAIEEPAAYAGVVRQRNKAFRSLEQKNPNAYGGTATDTRSITVRDTRRSRSVWSISPQPYREAHFAVMPPDLAERCLLAGSAICDTVLDPFGGAGTTALAAIKNGRSAVLIELNSRYCTLAKQRLGVPFDAIDWFNLAAAARDGLTKAIIG